MDVIVRAALPVFVSVELCAALVEPTARAPKSSVVGLTPTSGAAESPVPLRPRLCGLPVASSVIETDADRLPVTDGVNVAWIEHDAPTASVAGLSGQLLIWAKSAEFVPATTIAEIVRGAEPEFVSVELCEALALPTVRPANVRLVGLSVTAGAVPVPVNATACGLPDALFVIETLAERLPAAPGVNVTEMEQLDPAAIVLGATGQVLDCPKSAAFVPVTEMPLIERAALPELVRVTRRGVLALPTRWPPNARLVGASDTAGADGAAPEPKLLRMFAVVFWMPALAKLAL
jgi:hypothetical protein